MDIDTALRDTNLTAESTLRQAGNAQDTASPQLSKTHRHGSEEGYADEDITREPDSSGARGLDTLDLRCLPRVDGQPTELAARREKMAYFDKQCSKALEGLYFGSEYVARNLDILQRHGVTHIINCVGSLYPEYHAGKLRYKTLYLKDTPQEDILCVFHDCFDFIEKVRRSGGRVFVHCSQGVSRSATIVIGYIMWKLNQSYEAIFSHVKKIRGVVNPNIGFTCALMYWQKRRSAPVKRCRMFRLAPQSAEAPQYVVPKGISHACPANLDSRGVFIIHVPGKLYIWVGSQAAPPLTTAAESIAVRICRYDGIGAVPVLAVSEGREPPELMLTLMSEDNGADSLGGSVAYPASDLVPYPHFNPEYDEDYRIMHAALHGGGDEAQAMRTMSNASSQNDVLYSQPQPTSRSLSQYSSGSMGSMPLSYQSGPHYGMALGRTDVGARAAFSRRESESSSVPQLMMGFREGKLQRVGSVSANASQTMSGLHSPGRLQWSQADMAGAE